MKIGDPTEKIIRAVLSHTQDRIDFPTRLEKGQVLSARVLQWMAPDLALISSGDVRLWARCSVVLHPNETFKAEVLEVYPKVVLKVISRNSSSKVSILGTQGMFRVIANLHGKKARDLFLEAFRQWKALKGHREGDGWKRFLLDPMRPDLRSYLISSGILLESKLRKLLLNEGRVRKGEYIEGDLKATLLKESQTLAGSGERPQAIHALLEYIKGLQGLLAQPSVRGGHVLYIPLWLFGFERGDWGELYLRKGGPGRQRRNSWVIKMRLFVENLGSMVVIAQWSRGYFNGRLLAQDPNTLTLIQQGLPLLRERLLSIGLTRVQLICNPITDKEELYMPLWPLPDGIVQILV